LRSIDPVAGALLLSDVMPTIDVLLNILIVLYLAIEESSQVLAIISEADQERELQRFTAAVRFTEG
jgi:hypothetical protein